MASWNSVLYDALGAVLIIAVLALIGVIIRLIASAVNKKHAAEAESETGARVEAAPSEESANGELKLVGTDEKTAALIMGIVSFESGFPLNELSFNSIKLID